MAKYLEATPTLYGEDARRVIEEIEHPVYSEAKEKFLNECREIYRRIRRID